MNGQLIFDLSMVTVVFYLLLRSINNRSVFQEFKEQTDEEHANWHRDYERPTPNELAKRIDSAVLELNRRITGEKAYTEAVARDMDNLARDLRLLLDHLDLEVLPGPYVAKRGRDKR